MAKISKRFTVDMPVTKQVVHNGQLSQIHIGNIQLFVSAVLYFTADPDIDFDKIMWNGQDILPMLDNMPAADELMQSFTNAAFTYIQDVLLVEMAQTETIHA